MSDTKTFIDSITDIACNNMSIAEAVLEHNILSKDPVPHWNEIEGGINEAAEKVLDFLLEIGSWNDEMEYQCLLMVARNNTKLTLFIKQQWLAHDTDDAPVLDL